MASTWDTLDKIGIVVGIFTGLISLMIWVYLLRNEKRDNDLIAITLHVPENNFSATLPGKIRRKNLTRAELQGLLGMLPMQEAGKRYQIPALNDPAFFDGLMLAQVDRDIHEVVIDCEPEDLQQFNQTRLAQVCVLNQEVK
ncbi:hypothetical protein [Leucothrix pacifica]|uniref:Uncharacterized protein n=1 Tax=Leucothrix pacifica TaxID=1247513 RepID=A0A317CGG7_9GAMM|nr:hypothetical protein [Leucothrix pacifica]PWQ97645.1 hypothetical protein DKW60_09700 [Leucothrix pacifica]